MTGEVKIQNQIFHCHEIGFGKDCEKVFIDAEYASVYMHAYYYQNERRMQMCEVTYEICATVGAKVIIGSKVFKVTETELVPVLDHPKNNSDWGNPCREGFKAPYQSRWELSFALAKAAGRVIEITCEGNCPVRATFEAKEKYCSSEYEQHFFVFVHKYEKTYKVGRGLDEYYETSQRKDVLRTFSWPELVSY